MFTCAHQLEVNSGTPRIILETDKLIEKIESICVVAKNEFKL